MNIDLVPHLPRLRRYALMLDRDMADDLVQSACHCALLYQDIYDPAKGKEITWLVHILKLQYLSWCKLRWLSGTGGRKHYIRLREVELPGEEYGEDDRPPLLQPPALQTQPEGPARVLAEQVAAWIKRKRNLTAGERRTLLAELNDADDAVTMSSDGYPRSQYNMLYTARCKLRKAMEL